MTSASGLDFTLYRAYDPGHARWLNRDPIGEVGGVNLYAYVGGNPISNADPLGLFTLLGAVGGSFATGLGAEGWAGVYVTLPSPSNGWTPDAGVVGSGGIGAGWNVGAAWQVGISKGGEDDLNGITYNANVGGGPGSVTVAFDENGHPVAGMVGPSADFGASGVISQSKAAGLNDVGAWLGGTIYDIVSIWRHLHPPAPPAPQGCKQ